LPPPSFFPEKKFPAVEAHFWLDELFYYIDWLEKMELVSLKFMRELSKSATNVQALLQYQFTSKLSSFNNQLCPTKATQGIVDFDFPLAEVFRI
jgi:hypothetical protein